MGEKMTWTPAEVCEMFGISKSTLLRWEKEGKISPPTRDDDQNRLYTAEHLAEISKSKVQKSYRKLAERPSVSKEKSFALEEKWSLERFLFTQDRTGLYELFEHKELSPSTIHRLLQEAQRYQPSDELFREIIKLIYEKTAKAVETSQ